MLTNEDLQQLETILGRSRLTRFREVVEVLNPSTTLYLDLAYNLHILTMTVEEATALTVLESQVRQQAWLILGCQSLYLWFAGEQVAHYTIKDLESWTNLILEDSDMPAVAEAPAISSIVQQTARETIAPQLGGLIDRELKNFFESPEFRTLIETQVRDRVGAQLQSILDQWIGNGIPSEPEPVTVDVTPEAPEQPSETSTDEAPPFKVYQAYYQTLYSAIAAKYDQKQGLDMIGQIRKGTKKGSEFMDWLVSQYPENRRDRARDNLTKLSNINKVEQRLKKSNTDAQSQQRSQP